jgi:hypothetical protein
MELLGEWVMWNLVFGPFGDSISVGARYDEDIHYYPLAKTQQKKAKWPSCSRAATV